MHLLHGGLYMFVCFQGSQSSVVIQHVNYSTGRGTAEAEGAKEVSFEYSIKLVPPIKSEFSIQKLCELSMMFVMVRYR